MSRMCDRMIEKGAYAAPWTGKLARTPIFSKDKILKMFDDAPVFVIDNVAHYLYAGTTQEEWDDTKDFPNLAPPFPKFWMEYHYPKAMLTRRGLEVKQFAYDLLIGFYFESHDLYTEEMFSHFDPSARTLYAIKATYGETSMKTFYSNDDTRQREAAFVGEAERLLTTGVRGAHIDNERVLTGARWLMRCTMFMQIGDWVYGPISYWSYALNPDGLPLLPPNYAVIADDTGINHLGVEGADALGAENHSALLAISFLHCKNVSMTSPEPPPKLAKAYQKRHGRSMLRFHTLEIEPMRRVLKSEGQSEKTGIKKALAICRGHFKDYSKHGLFGKHKGLYWWDAHVRGSASEGTIVKDYAVNAPGKGNAPSLSGRSTPPKG